MTTKTKLLTLAERMAYCYQKTGLLRFAIAYHGLCSKLMRQGVRPEHLPLI